MRKIIGTLLLISALIIMIVCAVHMIIFRFQNPDSLIPWEIGAVLGYVVGGILVER